MLEKYINEIHKTINFDKIMEINKNTKKNIRKHIKTLKMMDGDYRTDRGYGEKNDQYDLSQADNNNQSNFVKHSGVSYNVINDSLSRIYSGEYIDDLKKNMDVDDYPLKMLEENINECKKFMKKMYSKKTPKIKSIAKILYGNAFLSLTYLYLDSKKSTSTNYVKKIIQSNKKFDKNKSLIELLENSGNTKNIKKTKNPENYFKYTYMKGLLSILLLNDEHMKEIKKDKICTFGISLIAIGFSELGN